jgi:hypothetical protein
VSDYKIYEIENAIKLMNRKKIITKVKYFAELRDQYVPESTKAQMRAEMCAIDLILDLLAVELGKREQKFKIRRTIV